MTGPARVAIYAAPGMGGSDARSTALLRRAEAWLGRSAAGGDVARIDAPGWSRAEIDAITIDARRYGFHGTLKAPFRLADGTTRDELDAAVAALAADRAPRTIPDLTLAVLGGFFALVPGRRDEGLHALADEVVTRFDRFRAPATAAETARRAPETLSPRQRELLERWGYPYVLDEFAFHLTLTDRIPTERQPEVRAVLERVFADDLGSDAPLDGLALCTEAAPGAPFRLDVVHELGADPRPEPASAGASDREGAR